MFEWEYRLVKSIPIVVVVLLFLNIFIVPHFEHYDDWNVGLALLGGITLLPWFFLLLTSWALRMPPSYNLVLYFIFVCNLSLILDYAGMIPLSDAGIMRFYAGLFAAFLLLYVVQRWRERGGRPDVESAGGDESLHKKMLLLAIKSWPMLITLCCVVRTMCEYWGFEGWIFSILTGPSFLMVVFFYVSSYLFRFCGYHRMFIHFLMANNLIYIYDWYFGLPESDAFWNLYAGAYCVAGLSLFIILYLYVTHNKKTAGADSERHRIG